MEGHIQTLAGQDGDGRGHALADGQLAHGSVLSYPWMQILLGPILVNAASLVPATVFGLLRRTGVTTQLNNGLGLPDPGTFAVCHAPPWSPSADGDHGCWRSY